MRDQLITDKCAICSGTMEHKYIPMEGWKVEGFLCGKCYSKKIHEHYPGKHERVNT